jgi:hypothetical protein
MSRKQIAAIFGLDPRQAALGAETEHGDGPAAPELRRMIRNPFTAPE